MPPGVLLNLRFLPMGIAIAPSLDERPLKRALIGQALIDFSWAAASRGEGRYDHRFMLGATFPNYPCWVVGTVIGVLAGGLIGDPERLGLDALFPAFFLALLLESEITATRRGRHRRPDRGRAGAGAYPLHPAGRAGHRLLPGRARRLPAGATAKRGGRGGMSDAWITIILLAIATAAIKASGPLAVGGRELGPRIAPVIDLLAPAILAGLIVVETVGGDRAIEIDPRIAGVAAAGCVLSPTALPP